MPSAHAYYLFRHKGQHILNNYYFEHSTLLYYLKCFDNISFIHSHGLQQYSVLKIRFGLFFIKLMKITTVDR